MRFQHGRRRRIVWGLVLAMGVLGSMIGRAEADERLLFFSQPDHRKPSGSDAPPADFSAPIVQPVSHSSESNSVRHHCSAPHPSSRRGTQSSPYHSNRLFAQFPDFGRRRSEDFL